MDAAGLDFFLTHCEQRYFAPGDVLVQPADGVVQQIFFIRQGAVTGVRGLADLSGGAFQYEVGDLFPLSAAVAQRAVTATYSAAADTFVLVLPCDAMRTLAQLSPTFADFLQPPHRPIPGAVAAAPCRWPTRRRHWPSNRWRRRLGELVSRAPVSCGPDTPLREALENMHRKRVGSILVVDAAGRPVGILTRYDVLGRIALGRSAADHADPGRSWCIRCMRSAMSRRRRTRPC